MVITIFEAASGAIIMTGLISVLLASWGKLRSSAAMWFVSMFCFALGFFQVDIFDKKTLCLLCLLVILSYAVARAIGTAKVVNASDPLVVSDRMFATMEKNIAEQKLMRSKRN